jgi:ABC-type bacteriocin/lantibiotic exporter with double-glycine peptidase domain
MLSLIDYLFFFLLSLTFQPIQQKGPTCLLAASLMSISARSSQIPEIQSIARNIPIYADGIDIYDLMIEFEKLGWQSLTFTAPVEASIRLLKAGFSPIAIIDQKQGKHAVSIMGIKQDQIQIVDPNQPTTQWIDIDLFEKMHLNQQWLVFFKTDEKAGLSTAKFPIHIAQLSDMKFRKNALILKSKMHKTDLIQKLSLLKQALAFDPQDQNLIDHIKTLESQH